MSRRLVPIVALLLAFQITASEWQLVHSAPDGGAVWSRSYPHPPYKELKGQVFTDGDAKLFISLLLDTERISEWVTHASSASVLIYKSPNQHMVHTVFSPPWPLRKRDIVSVSEFWRDMETGTVYLLAESRPHSQAPLKNHIRIHHSKGCWQITALSDSKIRIRYQGFTDVGGVLPYWATNPLAASSLHETLSSISSALRGTEMSELDIPLRDQADLSYCENIDKWE